MTAGKSKRVPKGKKSQNKTDAYAKKEWFQVKAPAPFGSKVFCRTVANKTIGTKTSNENLKHRQFEVPVGDLKEDKSFAHQLLKFRVDDTRGKTCYTSFAGFRFTRDKLASLVKKWQTLVDCAVETKTADGYTLRMFCIGFTKRRTLQVKKTSYAQKEQVRKLVGKMKQKMTSVAQSRNTTELIDALVQNLIGKEVEKSSQLIYPLQNVFVYKVKVLKYPQIDSTKIQALHTEYTQDVGQEQ